MRTLTKLLLAGAGTLAAGAAVAAAADKAHVMNVALPDGSIARIRYVGDVAPRIVVAPAAPVLPVSLFDPAPFAMVDQIAARMDAQMNAMLRQAATLAAAPVPAARLSQTALGSLPAGTVHYSFTSYSSGQGGSCSQSVQVTSLGADQAPKVVKQSSGDCSAMNTRAPIPAAAEAKPAPSPALGAAPIPVSYSAKPPHSVPKHGTTI